MYLLDTNIFIASWRLHYPPDLYPGLWNFLAQVAQNQQVLSIDRVRKEVFFPDDLVEWLNEHWSNSFVPSGEQQVVLVFSEMQKWVNSNPHFSSAAKADFADIADGWLAAYAKTHNAYLVTNEVFDASTKKKIPLPNLCKEFNIEYFNIIEMLRKFGVRFDMRQTP